MHFKKMNLVNASIACFYYFVQARIQDFLRGGSNLQKGFDLLKLPVNLLIFHDYSEISPCLAEPLWIHHCYVAFSRSKKQCIFRR